jgi:hypothetical protein
MCWPAPAQWGGLSQPQFELAQELEWERESWARAEGKIHRVDPSLTENPY